jgi:cytochrome P450
MVESDGLDQMSILLKQCQHKADTPYPLLESNLENRITEMCQTVIAAGSETTGATLTALTYYVLRNHHVLARLMAEIQDNASESIPDGTFPLKVVRG